MQPATRRAFHAAVLFTLIALGAPMVGAQQSRADSLLVAGASVRFRTSETAPRGTEAVIVARRGDTLDLRFTARWGANPAVTERSLDWRTLYGLEARSVSAADGPGGGAVFGFLVGVAIGAASAKPSGGSPDFSLSKNPGIFVRGVVGGLIGFALDAASENGSWVPINQP